VVVDWPLVPKRSAAVVDDHSVTLCASDGGCSLSAGIRAARRVVPSEATRLCPVDCVRLATTTTTTITRTTSGGKWQPPAAASQRQTGDVDHHHRSHMAALSLAARSAPPGLPASFGIAFDRATRSTDRGRALLGGSPLRWMRLSASGHELAERWRSGGAVGDDPAAQALARRLVDSGAAHPRPPAPDANSQVTIVVPVRDHADELFQLLRSLTPSAGRIATLVVVDDGSIDPIDVAGTFAGAAIRTIRSSSALGPARARNCGASYATTELVVFVDADVIVPPRWLEQLIAHFADPVVAAVAPRVSAGPSSEDATRRCTALGLYDASRSPLDLGSDPGLVHPGSRVPYVPSAALAVRRQALIDVGGFDPALRLGEDVDLVWRFHNSGWRVRYEPAVTVRHAVRPTVTKWIAQRFRYGTSAASLSRHHRSALAPIRISRWSLAACLTAMFGWPAASAGIVTMTTASLAWKLRDLPQPFTEAVRVAGIRHLHACSALGEALRRAWWPAGLVTAVWWPRARPALAAGMLLPPAWHWATARTALRFPRWMLLHLADDLAYGAGVWAGCFAAATARPLLPDLANRSGSSHRLRRGDLWGWRRTLQSR